MLKHTYAFAPLNAPWQRVSNYVLEFGFRYHPPTTVKRANVKNDFAAQNLFRET